ncbi:DUF1330 domain-containing protein [Ruegeria litorea]|uniref:DUF1330 domain-containing protein n=1 Tax=Falsiruegeria litorea TaxID=1280831 RepID=A0ABS5WK36_9RHOB|nr:DUF1330 domain-containing protein [Falsiruegeria litorea]MBT3139491.1 DUF1330 domain-containing protein [Falsiruegeria litorea]
MPAYVVAMMDVHDPELLLEYARQTPPMVRKYGGVYLTRGETPTCLEDTSCGLRVVVSQWPSKEAAIGFFNDPDYREVAKIRQQASTMKMLIIQDGVLDIDKPEPNVAIL